MNPPGPDVKPEQGVSGYGSGLDSREEHRSTGSTSRGTANGRDDHVVVPPVDQTRRAVRPVGVT